MRYVIILIELKMQPRIVYDCIVRKKSYSSDLTSSTKHQKSQRRNEHHSK
jgi:hypothetical protein